MKERSENLLNTSTGITGIKKAARRNNVQVHFSGGGLPEEQTYEGPTGTTVEEFIRAADLKLEAPAIAALVNMELRELTYRINTDSDVTPVTLADSDGMRIYRRSLSFLLITAAQELFPETRILIDYALNFGGFFCEVEGRPSFSEAELKQLEKRMREIAGEDAPILKERVSLHEAIRLLESRGQFDKVRLLQHRKKDYLVMYRLREYSDYFHGYMVPSTGYLEKFGLINYPPGFILRYPRRESPRKLRPPVKYPKLVSVFEEYGDWMRLMGVSDVGSLNQAIAEGRMREVVLVSEALHEQRIAQIAIEIASRRPRVHLVLIAGPSSSGKTTFSKRLSIQLLAKGIRPMTLGLDDYLVERAQTPRDETGDYDYETLDAQDLVLFNSQLSDLLAGREVTLPRYNFITGMREQGERVRLEEGQIIIVEGIHGMNPSLITEIDPERVYRVYISCLTQLNIDRHNRVSTTDTRLIRRIVRDATYRGYTAQNTIERWPKVRRGEYTHIFPYQENADVMMNSALVYELSVLKPFAEPLLLQIQPGTRAHIEAKRLLSFLQWFEPIPTDLTPDNSLLREFIGGSILRDYTP